MHQINDFDEDLREYMMHQMSDEQINTEQISDDQIN